VEVFGVGEDGAIGEPVGVIPDVDGVQGGAEGEEGEDDEGEDGEPAS
jgi:hypothetical protein